MSGRIGKYTYKINGVLREFLSAISRALGQRSAKKVIDKIKKDPEMKGVLSRIAKRQAELDKKLARKRKQDPELDKALKQAKI